MDRAKLAVVKIDKAFIVFPYTYSKIELRLRNLLVNNRSLLDGISHFANFWLVNHEFQSHLMENYTDHLRKL